MFGRTLNLIQKELLQISRDWLMIFVLVLGPVIQLALLGYSTGRSVANLSLAVLDLDHSTASRAVAVSLDNTRELILRYEAESLQQLERLINDGDADVGVIIPPNFARDLDAAARAPQAIGVIAGATNNVASSNGLYAAERAVSAYLSARQPASAPVVDLRIDVQFNPSLDSRQYTLPAMVGMIVFELSLMLASLGVTREREIGTLEQLIIMPFRRIEVIIGKAVPPLLMTLVEFPLMLLVTIQVFGVPMRGSMALLVALTTLFIAAEIGWGLLLSTVARTQQQAVLFVFVQAIIDLTLSGFLVPLENLPGAINLISNVVPLRHYLVIIRSIMLKGATIDVLWPQVLALAVLMVVIGAVAMRNLGRRLD
jgi:ABC-2 type transport system permease protein